MSLYSEETANILVLGKIKLLVILHKKQTNKTAASLLQKQEYMQMYCNNQQRESVTSTNTKRLK